jgi:hypothetical protein
MKPLKALSYRQASNCENAREKVCKCRCGGALHGAKRGDGEAFFEGLTDDDPHSWKGAEAKRQMKREAQAKELEEKLQKAREFWASWRES